MTVSHGYHVSFVTSTRQCLLACVKIPDFNSAVCETVSVQVSIVKNTFEILTNSLYRNMSHISNFRVCAPNAMV